MKRQLLWLGPGTYHPLPIPGGWLWSLSLEPPIAGTYLPNLRAARRITHHIIRPQQTYRRRTCTHQPKKGATNDHTRLRQRPT